MKILKANTITAAEFYSFGSGLYPQYGWNYNYEISQGILAWSGATSYVTGNKVYSTTTNKVYQSVAGSTGQDPALDTAHAFWVAIYSVNAWRMFDGIVGNPSIGYANGGGALTSRLIAVSLKPQTRFNAIALLDVRARYVLITVTDPDGGVWSRDLLTVDTTPVVDAWTYFFADCPVKRNIILDEIGFWYDPAASGGNGMVYIEISSNSDTVSVGEIVLGVTSSFGFTLENTNMSLVDYSTKDVNIYGEASIVSRSYSYRASFDVKVNTGSEGFALTSMADLRNVPAVYYPSVADLENGLGLYGYCSDFSVSHRLSNAAFATIKVEGLI